MTLQKNKETRKKTEMVKAAAVQVLQTKVARRGQISHACSVAAQLVKPTQNRPPFLGIRHCDQRGSIIVSCFPVH